MLDLCGHRGPIVGLAYSPDGRLLASASTDGSARLWETVSGRFVAELRSPALRAQCVAFSADGCRVAIGYQQPVGIAQVWDLADLDRPRQQWIAHRTAVRGIAFHVAGFDLVTIGNDSTPRLWKADDVYELDRPHSMSTSLTGLALGPDGSTLAAVSAKPGALFVWDLSRRRLGWRRFLPGQSGYSLAGSPDGRWLVCGMEDRVAVFPAGDPRGPALDWPAHDGAVLGVAFRPDGGAFMTAGTDGLLKSWALDGRLMTSVDWQIGELGCIATSPDGCTAATGGAERIIIWDLDR